jgi:hypothetical protein
MLGFYIFCTQRKGKEIKYVERIQENKKDWKDTPHEIY